MNKKYIKIGAITLASLGAIYGGYKLVKYLIKPSDEDFKPLPVEIVDTSNKEEVKQVAKPTFDGAKIVSKGSKGEEAKTIQQTLNNIINDAKKGLAIKYPLGFKANTELLNKPTSGFAPSFSTATTGDRLKQVASLKPLTVDGNFGAKSVSTLIVIMGKSSASYNEVRDKRIQFSKNYGLGNPYAKK
jgi:hypothetical protein